MSDASTRSIEELLARAAHDEEVIAAVVGRSYQRLSQLTAGLMSRYPTVGRGREAADLLHSAYGRLVQAIAEVKPTTLKDLLGLAAQHVRWTILDVARSESARRQRQIRHMEESAKRRTGGSDGDPAHVTALREVLKLVDALPAEQRSVVELIFFQGLSQREVALLLEVSEKTVQRRWFTANEVLQQHMREAGL